MLAYIAFVGVFMISVILWNAWGMPERLSTTMFGHLRFLRPPSSDEVQHSHPLKRGERTVEITLEQVKTPLVISSSFFSRFKPYSRLVVQSSADDEYENGDDNRTSDFDILNLVAMHGFAAICVYALLELNACLSLQRNQASGNGIWSEAIVLLVFSPALLCLFSSSLFRVSLGCNRRSVQSVASFLAVFVAVAAFLLHPATTEWFEFELDAADAHALLSAPPQTRLLAFRQVHAFTIAIAAAFLSRALVAPARDLCALYSLLVKDPVPCLDVQLLPRPVAPAAGAGAGAGTGAGGRRGAPGSGARDLPQWRLLAVLLLLFAPSALLLALWFRPAVRLLLAVFPLDVALGLDPRALAASLRVWLTLACGGAQAALVRVYLQTSLHQPVFQVRQVRYARAGGRAGLAGREARGARTRDSDHYMMCPA